MLTPVTISFIIPVITEIGGHYEQFNPNHIKYILSNIVKNARTIDGIIVSATDSKLIIRYLSASIQIVELADHNSISPDVCDILKKNYSYYDWVPNSDKYNNEQYIKQSYPTLLKFTLNLATYISPNLMVNDDIGDIIYAVMPAVYSSDEEWKFRYNNCNRLTFLDIPTDIQWEFPNEK